jgi:excisionase family DNA binding protein
MPHIDNRTINQPLAYSPNEACKLLGLGRTKTFELIKNGKLKSFKLGSRRIVTLEAIKDCLKDLEVESCNL